MTQLSQPAEGIERRYGNVATKHWLSLWLMAKNTVKNGLKTD